VRSSQILSPNYIKNLIMDSPPLPSTFTFDNVEFKVKADFLISPFSVEGPCSSSRKPPCAFRKKNTIESLQVYKNIGVQCVGCDKKIHLVCYFNKMKLIEEQHLRDSQGFVLPVCSQRCLKSRQKSKKELGNKRWNTDHVKESGPTSMTILLDWLTIEENATKYLSCKASPGKTVQDLKMQLVLPVSKKILEELGKFGL